MTQTPTPVHLFNDEQWQQLHPILHQLDRQQALWLSGYLAGGRSDPQTESTAIQSQGQSVLVAFGTETDNCRQLAQQLAQSCTGIGIQAEIVDLAGVRPRKLTKTETLILITATHGDGDPPEPIADFYEAIMADDAPALPDLAFAVLALGDSSYDHFCATGVALDNRFESLGAKRLINRQECDLDFEQPARAWFDQLLKILEPSPTNIDLGSNTPAPLSIVKSAVEYNKRNPISVEVLTNQNLSHPERKAAIHHLELALEDDGFRLDPGDAVGVLVDNPPELVALILDATELSGEQAVTHAGLALPLVEVLREHRDLTIPGKAFLELWSNVTQSEELKLIVGGDNSQQRQFLRDHQIRDLVHLYPARPEPQALVDALRPLQPRLYDVANSLDVVDDELHLTVKSYSYPFRNRLEPGIAAQYLLALEPGDNVRLYPHRNGRFHLPPQLETPIILIAEGTGIAPYRAFIQALSKTADRPPCWLIFAEKDFENDFLYQLDIQQALEDGVCRHVNATFSQISDGCSLAASVVNEGERLASWLLQGAHIYFCGEKASLEQCEAAIKTFVDEQAGAPAWKQLTKDKRIHRNLY
tara:strand:+ start:75 stop:1835 length:1761 start_codon:yes stop_codon:yes gene_type:complete